MLTARRRDTVCEEQAGIGKTGESQRMLAVEALHFIEAAGGGGSGRQELEGGDGDGGSGV